MAKVTSNQYVRVDWIPESVMTPTQAQAPTLAMLNDPLSFHLSEAIAWQDWELGATASDDVDDPGITDAGNATTRGFANYGGTLSFFRDRDWDTNPNSIYNQVYELFKTPRTRGYIVTRVAEKHWSEDYAVGDRISVYRFIADVWTDDTEGDTSVKMTVEFLPQGFLAPYTLVAGGSFTGLDPISVGVGDNALIRPMVEGKDVRAVSRYASDDPDVVEVSPNGVVTGISSGTADVTVRHPGVSTPGTVTVTVV